MKKLFLWSIKTHLVILVLIAILPAIGLVLYDGLQLEKQAVRDAHETAMQFTRSLSYQQERITEATKQLLVVIAHMKDVKTRHVPACNRLFQEVMIARPLYENLFLVDPAGEVIAAATGFKRQKVNHHKYFRDAVATKEFSAGEYDTGLSSGHHAFHFSYPVLDNGKRILAVLVAEIALDGDVSLFKGINLPMGYAFSASDHNGIRIINDIPRFVPVGQAERPVFMARQKGPSPEGTFSLIGIDGSKRLYGFRRLHLKEGGPPYMYIRAGLTEDEALAMPRQVLLRNMILTGVILILGMALAWTMGNILIVRRLKKLVSVSQELAEGKTDVHTGLDHDEGELGELAAAFDKMADDLERRAKHQCRMEASLRQSEAKYRSLVESTPDIVFMVDSNGLFRYMNPSWSIVTGYIVEDYLGKPFTSILSSKYQAVAMENFRSGMEGHKTLPYRVVIMHRYGTEIPMEVHEVTLHDDEGVAVGRLGVGRDLTERITAERVRQRLETQLWHAQKMEAMGKLAGGVAHDFNNILAAIIANTELLSDEQDEADRKECLSDVLVACKRAKNLIRQILSFSKQDNEDQIRYPMDIKEIMAEALSLLRSSLPVTIDIRSTLTSRPTIVKANATQIHQLVMNLATNAAYAMREQGGILTVTLDLIELAKGNVHPLQDGTYVGLTIGDTGIGIDPTIMDKIFDPFFTTKKPGEGTGLGLSVVYGIVKGIGGAIDIRTEPGKGTRFYVYLPQCLEQISGDMVQETEIPRGHERILFVDDEPAIAKSGRKMLSRLGYEVTALTDSVEAFNVFKRNPESFDLLLTDMTMPNLTGASLAREILKIRPDLPVILCTGYTELVTAEEIKRLGIRQFVLKPLSMREIGIIIRRVLDG